MEMDASNRKLNPVNASCIEEKKKDSSSMEAWGGAKRPVRVNVIIENISNAKIENLNAIEKNNYSIPADNMEQADSSKKSSLPAEMKKNMNNKSNKNKSKHTSNIEFTLCFKLKSLFSTPSSVLEKNKLKVFENLNEFLNQRMDLIHYLRTLYSLDITNHLLFNSYQKKMLEYPFKPNIFSKEDLHVFGLDRKLESYLSKREISGYYHSQLEENKLDKYDRKILKILPQELTDKIENISRMLEDDYY